MNNIEEVLRQKEAQLEQLQREVEALRLTAKLLSSGAPNELRSVAASDKQPPQPVVSAEPLPPAPQRASFAVDPAVVHPKAPTSKSTPAAPQGAKPNPTVRPPIEITAGTALLRQFP